MEPVSTPEGPDTSGPHFPSAAGLPTVMGPRNLHVVMNSAEPAIEGIPASDSSLSTTQDGSPNSTTSTPQLTPPSQTAEPCDSDRHGFTPTVQTALEPLHGHTSISTTQDGSPRPPTPAHQPASSDQATEPLVDSDRTTVQTVLEPQNGIPSTTDSTWSCASSVSSCTPAPTRARV